MRRRQGKHSTFSKISRSVFLLLLTVGFLTGISACVRNEVSTYQDRQPRLNLASFFVGETVAFGIFEDRFGNLRRQFRVEIEGTLDGDVLTLDEQFLYDDGERDQRIWKIRPMGQGSDGQTLYEGSADDIKGIAKGAIAGNAMNWQYDVVLTMSGRDLEVHFDDWIYRMHEDVAVNRAYVSKFGVEIGSVTIVFLRGDAAKAIAPLDL